MGSTIRWSALCLAALLLPGLLAAEEPLPAGAVLRLGTPSFHRDFISALAISPDGRWLATASWDYTVRLTDLKTGDEHQRFSTPGLCLRDHSLAFSPDSKHLAAADGTGFYHLWNTESGKVEQAHPFPAKGKVQLFVPAFAPQGEPLLVVWGDKEGFGLYDARNNSKVRDLDTAGGFSDTLAVATNSVLLARGSEKGVRVLALETGRQVRILEGDGKEVTDLAIARDGRTLAAVTSDEVLHVWDLADGRERRRFSLPERPPAAGVALSPDGSLLAVCSSPDRTLQLLERDSGKVRHVLTGLDSPRTMHLMFTPNGKSLIAEDGLWVRQWDVATGQPLRRERPGHRMQVKAVAYAPDGRTLASADRESLRLWDARTGEQLRKWTIQPDEVAVGFSADGQSLLAIQSERTLAFNPRTGAERWRSDHQEWRSPVVALAACEDLFAVPESEEAICLLRPRTGECLRRLSPEIRPLSPLASSPDGKYLAVLRFERLMRFDTGSKQALPFEGQRRVHLAAFSTDGQLLATADTESLMLWNVATRKRLGEAVVRPMGNWLELQAVAFSPDQRLVALSGWDRNYQERSIRLFEVATCQERFRLLNPGGPVWSLAFAPDDRHLASANSDTTVTVWDLNALPDAPPAGARSAAELDRLWNELASADAALAFRAVRTLIATPEQAVPLLRRLLHPAAGTDVRQVQRWIADLDSADFETREQASRELKRIGEYAGPALRKASDNNLGPEVRRRIEELLRVLEDVDTSPDTMRQLRAVETLERIGNADARRLLEALSRGAAEARLTRETRNALRRLGNAR